MKVTLIYDPDNGVAMADGKLLSHAKSLAETGGEFTFANEMYLTAFRLQITRGVISKDDVIIFTSPDRQECIPIVDGARLAFWPRNFCSKVDDWLSELLDWTPQNEKSS